MQCHFCDTNTCGWNIHLLKIDSCNTTDSVLSREQPWCQGEVALGEEFDYHGLVSTQSLNKPKLGDQAAMLLSIGKLGSGLS